MPILTPPESDWTCREVLDAHAVKPEGMARCQFCNRAIRWIHVLEHDDYHRSMEAGCCCATRLCYGYDATGAERELKNRMERLARFVEPRKWQQSRTNPANRWRIVAVNGKRIRVVIYLGDIGYGIYAGDVPHWTKYETVEEAKVAAFDMVEKANKR